MGAYFDALTEAMEMLARADERVLFIGQAVAYSGQRAHETFAAVPKERRIEMPICEDFTIGFATGLALEGFIPLVFIPRWDFLLLAANQLVNHLDKLAPNAKVLVRTSVGAKRPLNPGAQHTQNHSAAFRQMLHNVAVHEVIEPGGIVSTYRTALEMPGSAIIVEHMERYSL
jgi:pyruvate/2-oxoglutarate/acetoin dehydrogenase E1 component